MIFRDVTGTVGKTPMVELGRLGRGLPGRVVAKLEMQNPCGSVKDRVGVALIENAERQGGRLSQSSGPTAHTYYALC